MLGDALALTSAGLAPLLLLRLTHHRVGISATQTVLALSVILIFWALGLYRESSIHPGHEFRGVFFGASLGYSLIGAFELAHQPIDPVLVGATFCAWLLSVTSITLARTGIRERHGKLIFWGTPSAALDPGDFGLAVTSGISGCFRTALAAPDSKRRPTLFASEPSVTHPLRHAATPQFAPAIKRTLDVIVALTTALFLFPALSAICLAVVLSSPGPILYGQLRIGKGGCPFTAWKFRSMHPDADELLEDHLENDPVLLEEWLRDHKLKRDPRVTPVGRFLRKSSLDELPQLWNVFVGDMSLVGPRPIVSAEVGKYGESFSYYTSVPPGITGLWQISGRNNTTYQERVTIDTYYARNWSIWLDGYILCRTVKTVILREGAY
jgi:lipopolysaccharide/colanic/teichoic acid biosynthesis glycosyltransferase